jgi:hypothetical protein
MFRKAPLAASIIAAAFVTVPSAAAQGLETLGSRAAAMAAFVAVADDASAVAWNPSGLVTGPFFNVQLDLGRLTHKPDDGTAAGRQATALVAIGTTPLGLAYYRLDTRSFVAASPAVVGSSDRQNGQVLVRKLVTSHLGATVQQSVGDYVTLGATLKLVRGSVSTGSIVAPSWSGAFDRSDEFENRGSTRGDMDAGVMVAAGRIRVGAVVRNVTEPAFGEEDGPDERMSLARHVRAGVAWADRWPGISATVLSMDADLTRVPHPAGERRDVAVGAERWLAGRRLAMRGGLRASTVGEARPVVSVGGSYALRQGMYVDAFAARGTTHEQSWGIAARVTY